MGLATAVKLASSFVIAKVLAVYVGPAGFAIFGQFQNFISMVLTFSGNMVQSGVVKYIAEFRNDQNEKTKILSTAFFICLSSSLLICIVLLITAHFFAALLLNDVHLFWLIDVFALTLVLYVLNSFIISILNGEGQVKALAVVNMATSLAGLVLTFFLAKEMGLKGALLAQVLGQSVVFFIALLLVLKMHWFRWQHFTAGIDHGYAIKLLKFAAMAVTSALTVPVVQIIIREYIGHMLSWQDAGYWQAVTRISDGYLLLIITTLGVYYLPKLSGLKHAIEIKQEMRQAYLKVFPCVIVLALLVFIFKKEIILLLFSPQFAPMAPLFLFQLLGDVFKIASWLIAYNMLAKAMTRLFILSELGFSISYCVLSILLLKFFGLRGVTMAFFINYLMYFLFIGFVFYKKLRKDK